MEETWKSIRGYEWYQVSNLGRIRTFNKVSHTTRHGSRVWRDRIIKQKVSAKSPSARVDLWNADGHKTFLVHRLVLSTFSPVEDMDILTVNHKDGNRLNNNINNLEWVSRKENIAHGFDNGFYPTRKCSLQDANGVVVQFSSMAEASIFLKRNNGYISGLCKRGEHVAKAKDGALFTIANIENYEATSNWKTRIKGV